MFYMSCNFLLHEMVLHFLAEPLVFSHLPSSTSLFVAILRTKSREINVPANYKAYGPLAFFTVLAVLQLMTVRFRH